MFDFDESRITLTVFGQTDPGRTRAENQDCFLVADLTRSAEDGGVMIHPEAPAVQPSQWRPGEKGVLVVVADGMGGAAAGGLASKLAVSWIYHALAASWGVDRNHSPQQFATRLRESVEQTNARIYEEMVGRPELQGMGTTATVAGVLDGILYLAQVGDSRAYLVRRGVATQLTRDQSYVQALVDSGQMTIEEAEHSAYSSVILQALGTQPEVQVDLTYQQLRRGDAVLLCSDGLTRMVRPDELGEALAGERELGELCTELIRQANERGGPDNVTVVVLRADGDGLDEPDDGDVVGRREFVAPRD